MPTAEAAPSVPLFAPPDRRAAGSSLASDPSIAAAKTALRQRLRADRERFGDPQAGLALRDRVLASVPIPEDACVAGYWPFGPEMDVRPLLTVLAASGRPCALPVIQGRGRPLLFRRWTTATLLIPTGRFRIPEPPASEPEQVPDVLLVPLLAFDRRGYRLGYGAGYYDMTLARLRASKRILAVGIGYAAQEVEAVPRDAFDERVDWIVTEREAIRIPDPAPAVPDAKPDIEPDADPNSAA